MKLAELTHILNPDCDVYICSYNIVIWNGIVKDIPAAMLFRDIDNIHPNHQGYEDYDNEELSIVIHLSINNEN